MVVNTLFEEGIHTNDEASIRSDCWIQTLEMQQKKQRIRCSSSKFDWVMVDIRRYRSPKAGQSLLPTCSI